MGFKVNKDMINLSADQIREKIRSGEIEVPKSNSPDRAEFHEFCNTTPGSDDRKKFLEQDSSDDSGNDDPPPPPKPDGDTPPPSGNTPPPKEDDSQKDDDATPPPPPPKAEDDEEWAGYGSREEMVKAHKRLLEAIEQKQKEVNNLRASGGKQGRKIKDLQAQIAKQTEEMEGLREKDTGQGPADGKGDIQKPEKPKKPKPSDFEDGELDEGYEKALSQWEKDVEEYPDQYEQYLERLQKKSKTHTEKKKTGDSKINEMYEHYQAEKEQKQEQKRQQAWAGMWDEASEYQKQLNCQTKAPLSQINEQQLILLDENASAEAKSAAKAYIEALPKGDLDNYKRMIPILNGMYFSHGSTEVPKKAYKNLKAALWDLTDKTGRPLAERFANVHTTTDNLSKEQARQVEENRKRKNESVSAPPADGQSSGDDRLDQPTTNEEKKVRLRELVVMRKKNVRGFDSDPKLSKEFKSLVNDLGLMGGK